MRNSERSTFRRCRLKWHWSYNLGLTPPREKGALTFGTLVHEALATYYPPGRKRGTAPAITFEKLYLAQKRKFDQWDEEGNRVDALELGLSMLTEYLSEYGADDHIEIIAPEIPLAVDVYDKAGRYVCTWVGRGDAAYIDLSRSRPRRPCVGLLEHKTAKAIPEQLSIISGYGEQGQSYDWASSIVFETQGILPEGARIDHVLFNWLKKSLPSDKTRNAQGHVLNLPKKDALIAKAAELQIDVGKKPTVDSLTALLEAAGVDVPMLGEPAKRQPGPLLHRYPIDYGRNEHQSINFRIREEAREMRLVRDGKLRLLKNPTKDCDWDCPFKSACELHEMGGDYQSVLELEFEKWNPYDSYELMEEKSR